MTIYVSLRTHKYNIYIYRLFYIIQNNIYYIKYNKVYSIVYLQYSARKI